MPVPRLAYGVGVGQWISETYIYFVTFLGYYDRGGYFFYWICNQEIGLLDGFQGPKTEHFTLLKMTMFEK